MGRFSLTVVSETYTDGYMTFSNLSKKEDAKNLSEYVRAAGLHNWEPNSGYRSSARLVVGVSTWCGYDMKVLDALEEAAPVLEAKNLRVEVFDMDEVWHKAGSFDECVPGMDTTQVFTPIVGIWLNGQLTEKASGHHGRELVYNYLRSITGRDLRPR